MTDGIETQVSLKLGRGEGVLEYLANVIFSDRIIFRVFS